MDANFKLEIQTVRVDQLTPYYNNAKKHPRKQVEQIAESIKRFGNCDPIAVWENPKGEFEIVEGHGRLLALDMLGIEEAPVIFLDHLTDEERRAYTHVHNQLTLNSEFDMDILEDDFNDLPTFEWDIFGFDMGEIPSSCVEEMEREGKKPGEVWRLGDHVVVFADSESVQRVADAYGDASPASAASVVSDQQYFYSLIKTWEKMTGKKAEKII